MTKDLAFGNRVVRHPNNRAPRLQPGNPPKCANFAKYRLYFANRFAIFAKKVMEYRAKSQLLTAHENRTQQEQKLNYFIVRQSVFQMSFTLISAIPQMASLFWRR